MNSNRQRYDHELLGSSFAHNAEVAAVVSDRTSPLSIVTPCHGTPLYIMMSFDEVDAIECGHPGCPNQWKPDGTVEHWSA